MSNELEIEYLVETNPQQTDSAFYCWQHGWETIVTVKAGKREFHIGVNGEMRFDLPNGEVWRYADDLTGYGIDTDEKLSIFLALNPNAMTNNNWFEMCEVGEDDTWWEVYDSIDEAIEAVREKLNSTDNDDYPESLGELAVEQWVTLGE